MSFEKEIKKSLYEQLQRDLDFQEVLVDHNNISIEQFIKRHKTILKMKNWISNFEELEE